MLDVKTIIMLLFTDDEMDIEQSSSEDEDEVNGWCEGNDTQLLLLSPEVRLNI